MIDGDLFIDLIFTAGVAFWFGWLGGHLNGRAAERARTCGVSVPGHQTVSPPGIDGPAHERK